MFQRILVISSLIIIMTVIFSIVLMTRYYSNSLVQREMDLNLRTMERIEDYFNNKKRDWDTIIRDLYIRGDLMEDITDVLHHTYEEYIQIRMENYAEQESFTPNDSFTYINSVFSQDEDVNAVILQSTKYPDITYEFIYDYGEWNQSLNGEHVEDFSHLLTQDDVKDTYIQRLTINNPATLEEMGDLTIYYSTKTIKSMLRSEEDIESAYYLVDEQNNILIGENNDLPESVIQNLLSQDQAQEKWETPNFIVQKLTNINNTVSYMVLPKKELNAVTLARGTMWGLIILTLITALVLTYITIRKYSARIEQIDKTIKEVQEGNLSVRIPLTKHKDELTTISRSFNSMLDDINDYIEHVYVLNLKQQEAELKALQSQINPHFLFNTLETIRMSAVIEGSKKSGKMIYHLSRLLRYSLGEEESVPLARELENARQYLELIQLQHPDKLLFDLRMNDDADICHVPKLILQPIIENYIIHGFRKESHYNYIYVRTENAGDDIAVIVEDNGIGMSPERLEQIQNYLDDDEELDSLGMKNVHQRLKLTYGNAYGLEIESIESIGTRVTLKIPHGGA